MGREPISRDLGRQLLRRPGGRAEVSRRRSQKEEQTRNTRAESVEWEAYALEEHLGSDRRGRKGAERSEERGEERGERREATGGRGEVPEGEAHCLERLFFACGLTLRGDTCHKLALPLTDTKLALRLTDTKLALRLTDAKLALRLTDAKYWASSCPYPRRRGRPGWGFRHDALALALMLARIHGPVPGPNPGAVPCPDLDGLGDAFGGA